MVRHAPFIIKKSGVAALITLLIKSPAYAGAPLNYLHGNGDKAYPIVTLTWFLLGISIAVIVIISILVIAAIWRRPGISDARTGDKLPLERPSHGLEWIWAGVGLTAVFLLTSIVWTIIALNQIRFPNIRNPLTIEVTGHQWWWEVRYLSDDPAQIFTTANEIHIPTGKPVLVKLKSSDVIHSFWIPALSGKTDLIPGLTNETWIEARDPGIYQGQCTEYCGVEHAKMKILVVAEEPSDFAAWREHQLQSPEASLSSQISGGAAVFQARCAACHAIRGTEADGAVGPNLSHLMQRRTLAAGVFPNNSEDLTRWISDPQKIKPGSLMPKPELSPAELTELRAYLMSLQ